ncbi:hypothetical protein ACU8KH_04250 [Lachancea thermotolerans]
MKFIEIFHYDFVRYYNRHYIIINEGEVEVKDMLKPYSFSIKPKEKDLKQLVLKSDDLKFGKLYNTE